MLLYCIIPQFLFAQLTLLRFNHIALYPSFKFLYSTLPSKLPPKNPVSEYLSVSKFFAFTNSAMNSIAHDSLCTWTAFLSVGKSHLQSY